MATHFTHGLKKNAARAGVAALAAAAIVLPACSEPAEVDSQEDAIENVTTDEVADDASEYIGQEVTVRENVQEIVNDYAFLLDEDVLFGGTEILVINVSDSAIELPEGEGTPVQVTGEVQRLVLTDLEPELDPSIDIEADTDLFTDYEEQPVILARSIALSPNADEITEDPERYYGQRIALEGEVSTIESNGILTIEDESLFGGEDLLVIYPGGSIVAQEGEDVAITGSLKPFVIAEFEQDYDLTLELELKQQIEAEYENRPVFVADEIYPAAM